MLAWRRGVGRRKSQLGAAGPPPGLPLTARAMPPGPTPPSASQGTQRIADSCARKLLLYTMICMAPVPAGFTEITYRQRALGGDGIVANVVAVDNTSVIPSDGAELIADAWRDNIMPVVGSNLLFDGVTLRAGQGSGDPLVYEFDYGTAIAGGDPGITAPPNVAYLVRKNTNLGGRKNRGRMYLCGVLADELDSTATINTTFQATLSAAIDAWVAEVEALSFVGTMVLLHADASTPTPITSWSLQSKVATQRTRLRD